MSETDKTQNELRLARTRLDRAATELDTAIVTRLRAMRRDAVAAAGETAMSRLHLTCIRAVERVKRVLLHPVRQPQHRPARATSWLPLSAATTAVLVAVTAALLWWRAPTLVVTATTEDFEWVLTKESPDFFKELEFYSWLEDEHDAT